jgi:hypothetical protein
MTLSRDAQSLLDILPTEKDQALYFNDAMRRAGLLPDFDPWGNGRTRSYDAFHELADARLIHAEMRQAPDRDRQGMWLYKRPAP